MRRQAYGGDGNRAEFDLHNGKNRNDMRKDIIRNVLAGGCLLLALLSGGCSLPKAERTARQFLKAYYVDLDFDRALELSTEDSHQGIYYKKNMTSLSPYAKDEVPELNVLEVIIDPDDGNYAYCAYELNGYPRMLPLQKHDGKWLVDTDSDAIEGMGSSSMTGVSEIGFASAASSETLPTTGPGQRAREAREREATGRK